MGRTSGFSSPESELEIKVQPHRQTDPPHPVNAQMPTGSGGGGGGVGVGYNNNNHHQPHYYPPPRPRRLFKKWFPWLVPIIVIVNIALFVISMYVNNCPKNNDHCIASSSLGRFSFQPTKENPLLGPSAATLLKMGAMEVKKVVHKHQAWRLVSCIWLHAGVFHVLANMLSLIFVGIRLEQEFGFVRIGLLYMVAGVGGSLFSSLFQRTNISVGASGALFGLLGGMLSELFINWTIYQNKLEALWTLLIIIIINLAVGILPHVDNFAHLGGFVSGFLAGFILFVRPQFSWVNQRHAPPGYFATAPPKSKSKSKYKTYQLILLIIAFLLLVSGLVVGFVFLLRGVDGNEHCSWCHYLSCFPTPFWTCGGASCRSTQLENKLNLTCIQNNKTMLYILESEKNNPSTLQELCSELCK